MIFSTTIILCPPCTASTNNNIERCSARKGEIGNDQTTSAAAATRIITSTPATPAATGNNEHLDIAASGYGERIRAHLGEDVCAPARSGAVEIIMRCIAACRGLRGAAVLARHPIYPAAFVCTQIRGSPCKAIGEPRDMLTRIDSWSAFLQPEFSVSGICKLCIGVAVQKQVVGCSELVDVTVTVFCPVCRRMIGPLVVGVGSNVPAVEQRVVVHLMSPGRSIHAHAGLAIPNHVVVHNEIAAVVVEIDPGVGLRSIVVDPIVGNPRSFSIPSPYINKSVIIAEQAGFGDIIVADVVRKGSVQLDAVAPGTANGEDEGLLAQ